MNTSQLLESMLRGLVDDDEACACYPDLGALARAAEAAGAPIQWALLSEELPQARELVLHVAGALLDLLETIERGRAAAQTDGCPLWHALAEAPEWLQRPTQPDDRHDDIALLLERDETYGGDWQALIESLHRAGSDTWQWAIARCRAMQRFEREQRLPLRTLLSPRTDARLTAPIGPKKP